MRLSYRFFFFGLSEHVRQIKRRRCKRCYRNKDDRACNPTEFFGNRTEHYDGRVVGTHKEHIDDVTDRDTDKGVDHERDEAKL